MDVDNDAPESVLAAFEINGQACYSYFHDLDVDEAYAWLIEQQKKGILRPTGVYQGNVVWRGERDFSSTP